MSLRIETIVRKDVLDEGALSQQTMTILSFNSLVETMPKNPDT